MTPSKQVSKFSSSPLRQDSVVSYAPAKFQPLHGKQVEIWLDFWVTNKHLPKKKKKDRGNKDVKKDEYGDKEIKAFRVRWMWHNRK